jgi:hypothetical protein
VGVQVGELVGCVTRSARSPREAKNCAKNKDISLNKKSRYLSSNVQKRYTRRNHMPSHCALSTLSRSLSFASFFTRSGIQLDVS